MSTIRWCLESGVNNSHLYQVNWYDRLRDAKQAASELPMAPDGRPRPHRIRRFEYAPVAPGWERLILERVVVEKMRTE